MLFTKVKQIGFTQYWFTSYLPEHVRHDGAYSEWGAVSGGIPQGSTLRLCYFWCMNNVPSQVHHGKLLQYADDTALICTGGTLSSHYRSSKLD